MQRVIKTVYTNLCDLKLAIDGTIVMSQNLKDSLDAMYDARIPERWQKVTNILCHVPTRVGVISWVDRNISVLSITIDGTCYTRVIIFTNFVCFPCHKIL